MNILHLNSNFVFTKIYQNQLDNMSKEFTHKIFNPVKSGADFKYNSNSELFTPNILTKYDSLFSLHRKNKSRRYIEKNIRVHDVELIHAHTMTNDGLLAYDLFKKYKIPYILTIRNTDVNFSLKYKIHLRNLFKKTIKNASVIIFPNHVYKSRISKIFKGDSDIEKKINDSIIIPNGIDCYWHKNKKETPKKIADKKEIELLYVGRIYNNKNLHRVLKAINEINTQHLPYTLKFNVVGKVIDQDYFNELKNEFQFKYYEEKNKEEIKKIMQQMDVFTMPSTNETFGLVFIEAMSQNLPIVYTENEGIDGYFPDKKYGVAVNPGNYEDIKKGILYIINHYDLFQQSLVKSNYLDEFKWEVIGKKYEGLYKENSL